MADSDGNYIEHVPEDQGEGVKDFEEVGDPYFELRKEVQRQQLEMNEALAAHRRQKPEKGKEDLRLQLDRIESMLRKLDHVIGGHVLINGEWRQVMVPREDK